MARKLLVILFPLLLLAFASAASAQSASTKTAQAASGAASGAATKLKDQMQLLQEQRQTAVAKIKDDVKAVIQAKRDEFKLRIEIIKDQKKKALAVRIDARIAEVNNSHTKRFVNALAAIQIFLDKMRQSTDVKVLNEAAAAQTAIDTAKAAVDIQADKTYIMEVVDDSTLKLNAGTAVSQLRQDITAVHKLVIDAKQTVQKININKKLIKKAATNSAGL
jgi:hypothetical protein